MLPESLLYVIETRGADAFASALAGDSDTPEVVWTGEMRGSQLVPALLQVRAACRPETGGAAAGVAALQPMPRAAATSQASCHRHCHHWRRHPGAQRLRCTARAKTRP
jgi:hypothetical protein